MDQATVWIQLVLWALFALGTVGCVLSVHQSVRSGLVRSALVDVAVWCVMLFCFVVLHHWIERVLAT
jgi:uncharacterized membrane protein YqjE